MPKERNCDITDRIALFFRQVLPAFHFASAAIATAQTTLREMFHFEFKSARVMRDLLTRGNVSPCDVIECPPMIEYICAIRVA